MTKLRKEARDKGLLDSPPVAPRPATQKSSSKATATSKQIMKSTNVRSFDESSDASVKTEGTLSGEESGKPSVKEEAHGPSAAKANNKVISGRVTKSGKAPRQSKVSKAKDEDGNNAGNVVQNLTPEESMASDNDIKNEEDGPADHVAEDIVAEI